MNIVSSIMVISTTYYCHVYLMASTEMAFNILGLVFGIVLVFPVLVIYIADC